MSIDQLVKAYTTSEIESLNQTKKKKKKKKTQHEHRPTVQDIYHPFNTDIDQLVKTYTNWLRHIPYLQYEHRPTS